MKANERYLRQGGLMRCCIATLAETAYETEVGDVLSCRYENDPDNQNMVVAADGVWEWNR